MTVIPPPPKTQRPYKPMKKRGPKRGPKRAPIETQKSPLRLSQNRAELDRIVSRDEWRKVYEFYNKTGDINKLSEMTGLSPEKVEHLIEVGIDRLGLPPLRAYATDPSQVMDRIVEMKMDPSPTLPQTKPIYQELPETHKDEMVDRAARESIGAQLALSATMEIASAFFDVITAVKEQMAKPPEEGGLKLPENISLGYLRTLAGTAQTLTSTLSEAVRLNRLTQGEPEHNISVEIAYLLQKLPEEAIVRFAKDGKIPPQLRGRVEQNVIDVVPENVETLPSGGKDE